MIRYLLVTARLPALLPGCLPYSLPQSTHADPRPLAVVSKGISLRGLRKLRQTLREFFGEQRYATISTDGVNTEWVKVGGCLWCRCGLACPRVTGIRASIRSGGQRFGGLPGSRLCALTCTAVRVRVRALRHVPAHARIHDACPRWSRASTSAGWRRTRLWWHVRTWACRNTSSGTNVRPCVRGGRGLRARVFAHTNYRLRVSHPVHGMAS